MGALGAASLIQTILPISPARAGELVAGFVYIGPRLDWGWNESHAVAALALEGVPHAGVVQADYLPESTNYGSGKDDPQTRAYTEAMERLITDGGARLVISTSFDDDPFLLAMAKKHPNVAFRQASNFANSAYPPNVGSQNALINQGHYVNGVAAGLCTSTDKLGFVAGMPFGAVLLNVNSFLMGVRQTNPEATVRVIFTGEWEHAGHDAEAVNELVDAGCDVITYHLDSPRVASKRPRPAGSKHAGTASTKRSSRPRATSPAPNTGGSRCLRAMSKRCRRAGPCPTMSSAAMTRILSARARSARARRQKRSPRNDRNSSHEERGAIFAGPIKDNAGKIVVPAGTVYSPYDEALLKTDYLVDGIIGTLP
jgi:simple sugar transport system substrate-binding protein